MDFIFIPIIQLLTSEWSQQLKLYLAFVNFKHCTYVIYYNHFRHLTKLYDSIAKLKFITEGGKTLKVARGMFAKDGEYVEFNANCDCGGQVCRDIEFVISP